MKETEGVVGVESLPGHNDLGGRWREEHMEKRQGQGVGGRERESADVDGEKRWTAGWENAKSCWQERKHVQDTMREGVMG